MAISEKEVQIGITIEQAWDFTSEPDNWLPLMPGYISHSILSEDEIEWVFLGDFGFMKKKVTLQVEQLMRCEPASITFNLRGVSDPFKGAGYFELSYIDEGISAIKGSLDISAGGLMGGMVNSVLKTFVPQITSELVDKMKEELTGKTGLASG
ncbi:CoxG family protein [Bacillus sp. 1P06AnD]|uniref:CoxG family protein n=1 Tax=Bacillus sp. 1P06AnD TaxID=3132208 RepID=UPI0039A259C6